MRLGESQVVDVAPGTTLETLRDLVGLPAEEVRVVVRNHVHADLSDEVWDGDRVAFIPAVAGG